MPLRGHFSASMMVIKPVRAAVSARAGSSCGRLKRPGLLSIISGRGSETNGGGIVARLWSSKERTVGFRPISTDVLMYSRPWMPSRVGRTISDISVHIASKPGPENFPLYPAPETGTLPVSA